MIPKVASTSFSRFLINAHQKFVNGENNRRKIVEKILKYFPLGLQNLAYKGTFEASVSSSTYKALAVRHPMERLLSAYLNIIIREVKGTHKANLFYILQLFS